MEPTNNLELTSNTQEVATQLNSIVGNVITQTQLQGFERAYTTANAIQQLKIMLNDEYMKPIMELQGNKLGFRTDKDKNGGYPLAVVKNCLIEAVLLGVQPYGNQFNIIAGNTYLTKEGIGYVLNNWKGLSYTIICDIPEIQPGGKFAVIQAKIKWTLNGSEREETIPVSVKNDAYATVDSLLGKATRKARAWLLGSISGIEVTEGDVTETTYVDVTNQRANPRELAQDKSNQKVALHIEKSKSTQDLERCYTAIPRGNDELLQDYLIKWIDLSENIEQLEWIVGAIKDDFFDIIIKFDDKKKQLKSK